jgi:hypothetical protein
MNPFSWGAVKNFSKGIFGSGQPDPQYMAQMPHYEEDRNRLGGMLNGHSPYAGSEWGTLIGQLQQQASGQGPSLAQDAYRGAQQDNTAALGSMARGSASPAAARQAMLQQQRSGQGMAQGLATARTQEQLGAQGALGQALQGRDSINQNAYLQVLAAQLGLSEGQLRAMLGNQQYALGMSSQPTGLQRGMGMLAGIAGGISHVA